MFKVKRNSKGFTLIELLIVIAIIGILAAIAIPAYTGYTKKSKVSGVVNAMGAIKNSVLAYYTEKGNVNGLDIGTAAIGTTLGVNVPTQYISSANVNNTASNEVSINVILTNIGSGVDGCTLTLTSANNMQTWTWGGNIDSAYRPKQ